MSTSPSLYLQQTRGYDCSYSGLRNRSVGRTHWSDCDRGFAIPGSTGRPTNCVRRILHAYSRVRTSSAEHEPDLDVSGALPGFLIIGIGSAQWE